MNATATYTLDAWGMFGVIGWSALAGYLWGKRR